MTSCTSKGWSDDLFFFLDLSQSLLYFRVKVLIEYIENCKNYF